MMPDIAERIGIPRAVGVPFPFGHPLGHAGAADEHRFVLREALDLLRNADQEGTTSHLDIDWPNPEGDWHKRWQPKEPAPIIKALRG
jgi:hypothetical protein